jgi:hypothetical protein
MDEDTLDGYLDDLDNCGTLSDWELEFLDSMLSRARTPGWSARLSDKQLAKIVELWDRRC